MSDLFHVKEVSIGQWDSHWQHVPKANLLQSWQYGAAKEHGSIWRARRFLISDGSGRPVAISQVLTLSLPMLGGIARLNRGPLLLDHFSQDEFVERYLGVLRALLREARRQRWWMVQIAPELPDNEEVFRSLMQMGLQRRPDPPWASGRLDLGADEQALLMGLNGKWRNAMRKGERLGVLVTLHNGGSPEWDKLISNYSELQRSKGFKGLPESLLRGLAVQKGNRWQLDLFAARNPGSSSSDEIVGMLVTARHGDTATYLIGFANDQGRNMQANSVLLWRAILQAKEAGCAWFDIGGLNSTTPKGIAEFKKGVNAVSYALVGEWRWCCLRGLSR